MTEQTPLDAARWILARAEARGSEIVKVDRAVLAELVRLAEQAQQARERAAMVRQ